MTDDAPALNPPLPVNVDSPSKVPARKIRARTAGEASDERHVGCASRAYPRAARLAEPCPPGIAQGDANAYYAPSGAAGPPTGRRPVMADGEVYGEECQEDDDDFGAFVPNMRGRFWVRGEAPVVVDEGSTDAATIDHQPRFQSAQRGGRARPAGDDRRLRQRRTEPGPPCRRANHLRQPGWEIARSPEWNSPTLSSARTGGVRRLRRRTFPVLARPFFDTSIGAESLAGNLLSQRLGRQRQRGLHRRTAGGRGPLAAGHRPRQRRPDRHAAGLPLRPA